MNSKVGIPDDIEAYHQKLTQEDQTICLRLFDEITQALPEAIGKVWHGHPVWFIEGNPVVGYHRQKAALKVLFWSGQSFAAHGLIALGSFKAAGFEVKSLRELDVVAFQNWLAEARTIQWDYQGLPKKRSLTKLTEFSG